MKLQRQKMFPARSRKHGRRGAALVEMAMVLPIFVMISLGIIEFGRGLMVSQLVTNAAREGARLGSLDGSTNADVESTVRTFLAGAANVDATDVTVTVTITPAAGNPSPNNQLVNANLRDQVNVQVGVPFSKVSFLGGNYLSNKTIIGNATMRHE